MTSLSELERSATVGSKKVFADDTRHSLVSLAQLPLQTTFGDLLSEKRRNLDE